MMLQKYNNHLPGVLYSLLPDFEKYVSVNAIPIDINEVIMLERIKTILQCEPAVEVINSRTNF